MYIKNKKGQSTVEYVLLVTAVVAVMIAFATSKTGKLQTELNTTLNTALTDVNVDQLTTSRPQSSSTGYVENTYTVNVNP